MLLLLTSVLPIKKARRSAGLFLWGEQILLSVAVEVLDAVLDLLVAEKDGGEAALERSGAFTLIENHGIVLEVESTACVVHICNVKHYHGAVERDGTGELTLFCDSHIGDEV